MHTDNKDLVIHLMPTFKSGEQYILCAAEVNPRLTTNYLEAQIFRQFGYAYIMKNGRDLNKFSSTTIKKSLITIHSKLDLTGLKIAIGYKSMSQEIDIFIDENEHEFTIKKTQ